MCFVFILFYFLFDPFLPVQNFPRIIVCGFQGACSVFSMFWLVASSHKTALN